MAQAPDPRIRRTRERVVSTAQQLIRDHGPAAVTFGRISRECGVSRTTLYRHWDGPSALVSEAWNAMTERSGAPHSDDLRRDMIRIGRYLRDAVQSDLLRRSLPTFLAAAFDDPVIDATYRSYVAERSQSVIDRFESARNAGVLLESAEPERMLDLLAGAIYYRRLIRQIDTSDDEVERIVDDVLGPLLIR